MSRVSLNFSIFALLSFFHSFAADALWLVLTSERDLPAPGPGTNLTAIAFGDFDNNRTNDVVLGFADSAPSLVLMHAHTNSNPTAIELESLPITPGGLAFDIDRDQDLDLFFGT